MAVGSDSAYAAAHARVRAMVSTMLSPQTWLALREAEDYSTLIQLLQETVYGRFLAEVDAKLLTPRRAIYQATRHVAAAFDSLLRLVPSHAHELVAQLYRRYEVDNLKALLRGLETHASWERVRYVLFPLGEFTVLPAQEMMEAGGIGAAVELLQRTPYYGTLSHAMKRYAAGESLFPLEVALDLGYWRDLWRDVQGLPDQDREQAERLIGSELDVGNLVWAIRYRVNHHLSEEEIINYTLPIGYRVRDDSIRAIAAGADIAHVISEVVPTLGDTRELLRDPQDGLPKLEASLLRYIVERCRTAFLGYPFHIGIPVAYLLLTELEIQDLTVLVEAKSSKMPPDQVLPYLTVGYHDA
jgi:V/A-type H+-transporting ATPase subunit C